jgi:hypothetical protein
MYYCGHVLSKTAEERIDQHPRDMDTERRARFLMLNEDQDLRKDYQEYTGWITRRNKYHRYILTPNSSFRKFWELLGVFLLLLQVVSHFHPRVFRQLFGWLPVTDLYFAMDIFFRLRTGYFDDSTGRLVVDPDLIYSRYVKSGWFLFDILLSIPYNLIWTMWKYSAALRFATIQRSRVNRAAIFDGKFRSSLMKSVREYWKEWTAFEDLVSSKSFRRSSVLQKSFHIVVNSLRTSSNIRALQKLRSTMLFAHNTVMHARTLVTFSRTMETTFIDDDPDSTPH